MPVRRLIHDDAVDPGPEGGLTTELRERPEDLQEHFLGKVLRFLGITEQVQSKLKDHALVIGDQTGARLVVAFGALLHQRPVGTCGCLPKRALAMASLRSLPPW